jgi:hypothetical protein
MANITSDGWDVYGMPWVGEDVPLMELMHVKCRVQALNPFTKTCSIFKIPAIELELDEGKACAGRP